MVTTWDDAPLYRKRPARFKAVQYIKDEPLPPDTHYMKSADGLTEVLVTSIRDLTYQIDEGDWLVKDLLTGESCVVRNAVFELLFEVTD